MSTIKSGNYSFREPPFKDGDVVTGGNYSQLNPNTEICKSVTNLTILGGNFCNCKPQLTWTVTGGNFCQKSFCSHEHPEWIARGLHECAEDCIHRDGTEKQWVNVEEEDLKTEADSMSAEKAPVQVLKEVDSYGITRQTFQKQVFVYKDTNLGCNKPKKVTQIGDLEIPK